MLDKWHKNVILIGDFNFPGWDWKRQKMKPNAQYPALYDEFKSLLNDNGMVKEVTNATRENNILDLVSRVKYSWRDQQNVSVPRN